MIEHVVLFKALPESTPEQLQKMLQELLGLKKIIPGIISMTGGVNFSQRAQGFTHGLVIRFRDRAALEGYIPHASHQAVIKNYIEPVCHDRLVLDYEILEG